MHEFRADRAAVEFSRRRGGRAFEDQFGMFNRRKETQRIEVRRKIAPAPVALKYALVLGASPLCCFPH